eukprot:g3971.t1
MDEMWNEIAPNNNNVVSLQEVTKFIEKRFVSLNIRDATFKAYTWSCARYGMNGTEYQVAREDFRDLLRNILYFHKAWILFQKSDKGLINIGESSLDFEEFKGVINLLSLNFSVKELIIAFNRIDTSGKNEISFSEFSLWLASEMTRHFNEGFQAQSCMDDVDSNPQVNFRESKKAQVGDTWVKGPWNKMKENFRQKEADAALKRSQRCLTKYNEMFDPLHADANKFLKSESNDMIEEWLNCKSFKGMYDAEELKTCLALRWPKLGKLKWWKNLISRVFESNSKSSNKQCSEREVKIIVRDTVVFARVWQILNDLDINMMELEDELKIDGDLFRMICESYNTGIDDEGISVAFQNLQQENGNVDFITYNIVCLWLAEMFYPIRNHSISVVTAAAQIAARSTLSEDEKKEFVKWAKSADKDICRWQEVLVPVIDKTLQRVASITMNCDFDKESPWSSVSILDDMDLSYGQTASKALHQRWASLKVLRNVLEKKKKTDRLSKMEKEKEEEETSTRSLKKKSNKKKQTSPRIRQGGFDVTMNTAKKEKSGKQQKLERRGRSKIIAPLPLREENKSTTKGNQLPSARKSERKQNRSRKNRKMRGPRSIQIDSHVTRQSKIPKLRSTGKKIRFKDDGNESIGDYRDDPSLSSFHPNPQPKQQSNRNRKGKKIFGGKNPPQYKLKPPRVGPRNMKPQEEHMKVDQMLQQVLKEERVLKKREEELRKKLREIQLSIN